MTYNMLNSYCTHRPFAIIDNVPSVVDVKSKVLPTSSPDIFGPPVWAYLHISTVHLPEDPSPVTIQHVRNTIFAVPMLVPCEKCTIHMGNYLESRRGEIEKLKSGSGFFKMTVDMHNFVNKRLSRPTFSYEEAYQLWKGEQKKSLK